MATSIIIVATTFALWSSLSNATCSRSSSSIASRSKLSTSSLFAFPNLFLPTMTTKKVYGDIELEDRLLAMIENGGSSSSNSRLDISNEVSTIVSLLEASTRSIPRPAIAPQVYGRWKLLRTSNTNTASPIQRKAVDTSKFDIYQDIIIVNENDNNNDDDNKRRTKKSGLLVRQIVEFSNTTRLYVDALGSTSSYPLDKLTDRIDDGTILGMNILGVSLVGENAIENKNNLCGPDSRIRFVFDEGKFILFNGKLTIPYPVPFRNPLFRDAVKGWIDITYLSDRVRISRGNKGSTFILRKVT